MKPKPLDLEKLKKELSNPYYPEEYVEQDIISKVRRCVKSACEFYLRYKDKQELFANEQFMNFEFNILGNVVETKNGKKIDYNEWLFKLAFKDVLGDKK